MSDDYIGEKGLDTRQLLEDGFMEQLGKTPVGETPVPDPVELQETPAQSSPNRPEPKATVNREKLLNELDEIKNRLIDTFACGDQSKVGEIITAQINRISRCASALGAPADHFDPLDHMSGLDAPNLQKNAEAVISNTKTCYKLGEVKENGLSGDANEVLIMFTGSNGGVRYSAAGTIRGTEWQGNEAIDYVYSPGSGKMSVKAFIGGKWIDKSSSFDISWELSEEDSSADNLESNKEEPSNNEGDDFDIIEK